MSNELFPMGTGDPIKVKVLFDALQRCMNEELPKGQYSHMDVMLAVHNFHKITTLSIEEQTQDREAVWRQTAVETLRIALKNAEPLKKK